MAREDNLRPVSWKPGQSGNPKGKPKGTKSISTFLRKLLDKEISAPRGSELASGKITVAERLALSLISQANLGNIRAAVEILDRTEGKVKDVVEQTNKNDLPSWLVDMAPKPIKDIDRKKNDIEMDE